MSSSAHGGGDHRPPPRGGAASSAPRQGAAKVASLIDAYRAASRLLAREEKAGQTPSSSNTTASHANGRANPLTQPEICVALAKLADATEGEFRRRGNSASTTTTTTTTRRRDGGAALSPRSEEGVEGGTVKGEQEQLVDELARVVQLLAQQHATLLGKGSDAACAGASMRDANVQAGMPAGAPPSTSAATYVRVDGAGHFRDDAPVGFDTPAARIAAASKPPAPPKNSTTTPLPPRTTASRAVPVPERIAQLAMPRTPPEEVRPTTTRKSAPTTPAGTPTTQPQRRTPESSSPPLQRQDPAEPQLFESQHERRYAAREREQAFARLSSPRVTPVFRASVPQVHAERRLSEVQMSAVSNRLYSEAQARQEARSRMLEERRAEDEAAFQAQQPRASRQSAEMIKQAGGKRAALSQLKLRANMRRAELTRRVEESHTREMAVKPAISSFAASLPRPSPEAWDTWDKRRQAKLQLLREERDRMEMRDATFQPNVEASSRSLAHLAKLRQHEAMWEREADALARYAMQASAGGDNQDEQALIGGASTTSTDAPWLLEDMGSGGPGEEGMGDSDHPEKPLLTLPGNADRSATKSSHLMRSKSSPARPDAVVHGAPFDTPVRAWLPEPEMNEVEKKRATTFVVTATRARAEAEKVKAEAARAEAELAKAEVERVKAEAERVKAEAEAEAARAKAEAEKIRAEAEAEAEASKRRAAEAEQQGINGKKPPLREFKANGSSAMEKRAFELARATARIGSPSRSKMSRTSPRKPPFVTPTTTTPEVASPRTESSSSPPKQPHKRTTLSEKMCVTEEPDIHEVKEVRNQAIHDPTSDGFVKSPNTTKSRK
ncbi:TPX2 C-terminal domain-containing protein [Pseudoscourfieldia marina]